MTPPASTRYVTRRTAIPRGHTAPYARETDLSLSLSRMNGNPCRAEKRRCDSGDCGLIPATVTPRSASAACRSRTMHAWAVHAGVKSAG